jgi:type I restriction enzyme S subunit
MSVDWPIVRLSDCASFQEGYVNPTQKKPEYFGGDVKWLRAVDLNNGYVKETTRSLTKAGFESAGKSALLFKPGTLAISKSGTIGRIGILQDYMCGNRAVINIKVNDEKCNNRFIFYVLLANRPTIENLAIGSVQKNLYTSALGSLEFRLPPREIQDVIAQSLGSLDDKIQLNRQTNQTLEQIAQAIFKSWFVDFEPTRAKIAAKQKGGNALAQSLAAQAVICGAITLEQLQGLEEDYRGLESQLHPLITNKFPHQLAGLDYWTPDTLQTTADLFPDALVESEMGEVPKGWEVKTLDKKMIPKKGKNITKTTITPGSVPVVAGGLTPAYYHNAHNVTAPVITISASGANAGFINLYHQNIWCSDCSFVNKEEAEYLYSAYLFFKSRQDEITKMQQGAAQPHVYPKDLYRLALADPQKDIWQKVECVVTPLFESIKSNIEEVISLSELRDTLLPKLLSGELSISIGQEAISVQN